MRLAEQLIADYDEATEDYQNAAVGPPRDYIAPRVLVARLALLMAMENLPNKRVVRNAVESIRALIVSSRGVVGLHQNGDEAPWLELERGGEFSQWLRDFNALEDALDLEDEMK